eukprot:6458983-Amphidinium_carterae.1
MPPPNFKIDLTAAQDLHEPLSKKWLRATAHRVTTLTLQHVQTHYKPVNIFYSSVPVQTKQLHSIP